MGGKSMALIKCPECGHTVSDKAVKCPKCGYPLQSMVNEEEKKMDGAVSEEKGRKKDNYFKFVSKQNKQLPKSIIIVGMVVILLLIVIFSVMGIGGKVSVSNIEISKWKLTEDGNYGDTYEGTVISDETKPFVAVIASYEEDDESSIPDLVYMEDGKGIYETYESEDNDPSVEYKPIGYISGKSITESFCNSITYEDSDYYDSSISNMTSCNVTINFETTSSKDGLLFFEIQNDFNNQIERNCVATIIHGKGEYTAYMSDLPLKSRGIDVTITPKFFCTSKTLTSEKYYIEKEFSVEKDEGNYYTSYTGTEELFFEKYSDGIILYSEMLKDGGKKENRGKTYNRSTYLKNERCTVTTYDSIDSDEKSLSPKYEFNITGYIPVVQLEKNAI